jgi:cytochrome P450
MLLLARQPALQEQLRSEPSGIQGFVDEVIRFTPPVHGLFRYAKRDCEVDGVRIPAGSVLWLLYAAANRDPERFADPGDFDPRRRSARQALSFGHGIHFCPGQPLARFEARVAFTELLRRMDEIRLDEDADELQWPFWFVLRGPTSLPLLFKPI